MQVDVAKRAFQSEDAVEEEDEDREASPKAVGHNIFILAKQVLVSPIAIDFRIFVLAKQIGVCPTAVGHNICLAKLDSVSPKAEGNGLHCLLSLFVWGF